MKKLTKTVSVVATLGNMAVLFLLSMAPGLHAEPAMLGAGISYCILAAYYVEQNAKLKPATVFGVVLLSHICIVVASVFLALSAAPTFSATIPEYFVIGLAPVLCGVAMFYVFFVVARFLARTADKVF